MFVKMEKESLQSEWSHVPGFEEGWRLCSNNLMKFLWTGRLLNISDGWFAGIIRWHQFRCLPDFSWLVSLLWVPSGRHSPLDFTYKETDCGWLSPEDWLPWRSDPQRRGRPWGALPQAGDWSGQWWLQPVPWVQATGVRAQKESFFPSQLAPGVVSSLSS